MALYSSRLVRVVLGVFSFFIITYLVFDLLFDVSGVLELQIKELPATWITALILIALLIADILIPVPSSILVVVSGILFGGFLGGVITLVGSILGSVINFGVSRRLGQARVQTWLKNEEYDRLSSIMKRYGAFIVILTRMMPLAMETISSISGISTMRLRKFIFLNIVGFAPITFLYSYTGAFYKNEPQNIFVVLFVGFFLPLIIWYIVLKTSKVGIDRPEMEKLAD